MRVPRLVLLSVVLAACADPGQARPADPERPVSVHIRTGRFIRATYVDSASFAGPYEPQRTASLARAARLWREYATPEIDSVVVHVGNRPDGDLPPGASRTVYYFPFTRAEVLGTPVDTAVPAPPADPTAPESIDLHPGAYVCVQYVDSALAHAPMLRTDALLPLARRVWTRRGTPDMDSVVVVVRDRAERATRRRSSRFTREEVQGSR